MLSLDDPKWQQLKGGYRDSYDPTPAFKQLKLGKDVASIWNEFWDNLHHQGDVDEASYAIVPHLVKLQKERGNLDWNFYALVSTIEIERHRKNNPPLPEWLKASYLTAWQDLLHLALRELTASNDELMVRVAFATLAIAKGNLKYGAIILKWDNSEIDEILEKYFAWSELYNLSNA